MAAFSSRIDSNRTVGTTVGGTSFAPGFAPGEANNPRTLQSILGSIRGGGRPRGNTFGVPQAPSRLSGENVRESILDIEGDAGISEEDFTSIEGRLRQSIEGRAGTEIANLSRRTGGDTSSPLFNLISSTIRGGSIADVSGKLADLRIQNKFQAQRNQFERSGLLLSLLGLETGQAFQREQLGVNEQLSRLGLANQATDIANRFTLGQGQLGIAETQLGFTQQAIDEARAGRQKGGVTLIGSAGA